MKAKAPSPSARLDADLALQVACHEWLVAIDSTVIERIALGDTFAPRVEVHGEASSDLHPGDLHSGFLGVLRSERRDFAAWDLATLLGREPESGAWVLLRIDDGRSESLPIALRTGTCRLVGKLPESSLSRLPRGMFGAERRPFRGAFAPSAGRVNAKATVGGLALDLQHLFTRAELEWSRRALQAKNRRGER